MRVSIIIPTYNEEDTIGQCLESLSKQTIKDLEIIVVDDGSKDNSKLKIKNAKLQFKIQNLRLFSQKHQGPGSARNMGAKHAKGDILVFVDADMTFEKDFVRKLVAQIISGKTKGTFSKEEYVANPDNVWSKCWGINENWAEGKRHTKNYPEHQKVFRAVLKSEFDKAGGFTPIGYTDDWTLAEKLGYEAVAAPGAIFFHKNPETLQEVFLQARWIGKRKYKFGMVGKFVSLVRASLPAALLFGVAKAVLYQKPQFIIFKIVYDFGIFVGVLSWFLGAGTAK